MVLTDRIKDIEVLSVQQTGARQIATVFTDCLPRKRVFVTDVDTLLGRTICGKFSDAHDWEIVGTKCNNLNDPSAKVPPRVGGIVPSFTEDPIAFKTAVLHADVIICSLRDDTHDAAAALRILSNTLFEDEKVFVLVSSVLTWAETDKALKAKAAADAKAEKEAIRKERIENGEDPDDDEEEEEQQNNKDEEEEGYEAEPPQVFSDSNDHERVPHARYQHWRLLEQATKFANSESLHTYVLTAGVLYGGAEEALAPLFSAAWHREPLPIVRPLAANVIPTIHVADLSTAVYNISNAEEAHGNRYMLAVDNGNNTSAEIIGAMCKTMGDPSDEPLLAEPPVGAASRWFDHFSLDIRLEANNFGALLSDEEWVSQGGLVENMLKVAAEYREAHSLTPLRVAVVGPPASGKSSLAKWISERYGLEHITVPSIMSYYSKHRDQVFKKLVAHREVKRVAAQKRADEEAALEAESASALSGRDSTESGGQVLPSAQQQQRMMKRNNQQQQDDDDEDFVDEEGDDFQVRFSVPTPPPAPSRMTNDASEYGTEDGDSRAPSSAPGTGRRGGGGGGGGGAATDEDGSGPAVPVSPEVDAAEDKEEDEDDDDALAQMKEDLRLCNKVVSLKDDKGRLIDHALAVMARYKIMNSAQGKNQGYVLDGFPKTTRQAAYTFAQPDNDPVNSLPDFDEDGKLPEDVVSSPLLLADPAMQQQQQQQDDADLAHLIENVDPDLMLEYAIVLDATDGVIASRAAHLGGNSAVALERMYRRMAYNRATNARDAKPGVSVQSWLRAILTSGDSAASRSVAVLSVDTDVSWPVTGHAAVSQVSSFLGVPHCVHPTTKELEDAQREAEERIARQQAEDAQHNALRKQREEAEEAERKAIAASHARRLSTTTDEGRAAAEVCSIPARSYLTDYIAAPLASCVADVARVRPSDPLQTLSDKLYQYEAPIVHAKEILVTRGGGVAGSSSNNKTPRNTPRSRVS